MFDLSLELGISVLQKEPPPCLVRRTMGHTLVVRDGNTIRAPEQGSGNPSTLN